MSHDESSIGFSSCRTRLTQNEQVLPEFLCNILRLKLWQSRGPTNPGWQLALNVQIIPKIWQKTSRKRYPIHVIVSFFFPFQRFLDGVFDPLKETHHSVDFQETQEEQKWREISSSSPPRIFPPSVVWWAIGWCARALKACESQRWIFWKFVELILLWRIYPPGN